MKKDSIIRYSLSLLGAVAFLFWWLGHPELLSFHEQNQMFLFTSHYFTESINVAGGFSDYISEFLVQFFYYPAVGAVIVALLLMVMHILTEQAFKCLASNWVWLCRICSFAVVILLWLHMTDENTMVSYPLAIILSLAAFLLCRRFGWIGQLVVSLPLYWLVGPAFIVQVGLAIADSWHKDSIKSAVACSLTLTISTIGWIYICRTLWVAQFPWNTVLAGINYHRLTRMTMESPSLQYAVIYLLLALSFCLTILNAFWQKRNVKSAKKADIIAALLCACIYGGIITPQIQNGHHNQDTHIILEQLYLLRKKDWNKIIAKAEEYKRSNAEALYTPLSGNAVNLALAMTGQLSTRMFEFPQTGLQSLMMPRVRDNVSNITTMEVFWQLGFINESIRYAFDSQESIINCRKSAYLMKRMVEGNILNGRYDVASKYIDLLKQTLFYKEWAEIAETFLYNEDKINGFPEWNRKKQLRLSDDFLFYYPEMTKMLGQLVLHNRENRLAFDYFMASLLLAGDAQSFVANLPRQPQPGVDPFPHGYKNYVEYMKTHATAADAVTSASAFH